MMFRFVFGNRGETKPTEVAGKLVIPIRGDTSSVAICAIEWMHLF